MKCLQKQILEFGLPTLCISDAGTPIVGRMNKVKKYIFNNELIQQFLKEQQIDSVNFSNFPKGNHELGGLIETINRMIRKLLFGSVRNLLLSISDFDFLLVKVCSILNKRPLVLKESLRTSNEFDTPEIITPEMLVYGRSLSYLNILPELHTNDIVDIDFDSIDYNKELEKIRKLSSHIHSIYHDHFLQHLVIQSTNNKDFYRPKNHQDIKVGDLVLNKDLFLKPHHYPLAKVIKVITNSLGEVTEVTLIKGNRETVNRHVFAVIPLMSLNSDNETQSVTNPEQKHKSDHKAARDVNLKLHNWIIDGKV